MESIVVSKTCISHCTIAEMVGKGSMLCVLFAFTHNMVVLSLHAYSQNPGVSADQ